MSETTQTKTLPLRPGETLLLNGMPLHMAADGSLRVPAGARVATRGDIAEDAARADTVAKRILVVLQAMSLEPEAPEKLRADLLDLLGQRAEGSQLEPVVHGLATIEMLARAGNYSGAMEVCRHLIGFDDALVRDFPSAG
jgi:flagellar biosynthesis repressor protein FlbT